MMEILNMVVGRRTGVRNRDAKAINPQSAEINDWSEADAA
jgi:hypothetical protein